MESATSSTTRNIVVIAAVLAVSFCACSACAVAGLWAVGAATFAARTSDAGPLRGIERVVGAPGRVSARSTISQSFELGGGGRLVVDLDVGDVRVDASDGDTVSVEADIVARGRDEADARANLDRVRLEIVPDGRVVRVTAATDRSTAWWGDTPQVGLRISVPRNTSLDIAVDVGEVRLEGTQGDVAVEVDVGQVVLREIIADESLSVQTDVASVEFEGELADGAAYDFRSDVGRIALRLPVGSRFAVDAVSRLGAVDVGFDVDGEISGSLVGRSVTGTVNGGGDTTVTARSNVGAISIEPR